MLTLLFLICMLAVFGKLFVFGMRVSWGIVKMFFTIIFLPFTLLAMVFGGLLSIAFPVLILVGIGSLLLRD